MKIVDCGSTKKNLENNYPKSVNLQYQAYAL